MPEATNLQTPQQKRMQAILRANLKKAIAQASDAMVPLDGAVTQTNPQSLAIRLSAAKKIDKTQIHNLETLAYTTNKVSEITDWLKRQIGRDSKNQGWGHDQTGVMVMKALEGLSKQADTIAADLDPEGYDLPRRVHLELCREYVKHLAAEFLYKKKDEA